MNLSEVFIRRPIATSLLMLAITMVGIVAYQALPITDLPSVEYPTITVNAGLPGSDPATMASSVASPLERQFTTIAGLDSMTSSSSTGSTAVTLQFALDRDIDSAAVDVQTAIAEAMPLLPPGMPAPPSFRKVNPADTPVNSVNLVTGTHPMWELDDYAESVIAPTVAMVSGVAQVNVQGAQKYAVRVQVDPRKLQTQQIGIDEVDAALRDWNVNLPTGQLYGSAATYNIKASGQLTNADAFRSLAVGFRRGVPVRLEQVATVLDSVEDNHNWSYVYTSAGEQRSILISVMKQPGANVIEVSDRVNSLFPAFQRLLPPSIHLVAGTDKAFNIRAAFKDIQVTMLITLGLVVGVIYLFLRKASATIIPALALPFSILGTLAVMKLLHFSLNNLSMMALILSLGFVVDDAIVMLENITRHIENGESPVAAALSGSKEISFTIVTMTVSLAAVFIPVLFMSGVLGRLFREFAVTITTAVLISGVVSVTLTPMLCSRFLQSPKEREPSSFSVALERLFDAMLRGYAVTLRWVLQRRPLMLAVFALVLMATLRMFSIVPTGFVPDQDSDMLQVSLRAAQGTSPIDVIDWGRHVARIIKKNPNVDRVFSVVGGGNVAVLPVLLRRRAERQESAQEILQKIRPQIGAFPNFRATISMPPALTIGGRIGDNTYSVVLQNPNTEELYTLAERFERDMGTLPGVRDITSDVEIKSPQVTLVLNRDKAASVGLDATTLANGLYSSYGPRWSSTIYGPKNQYRVLLELDPRYQESPDALRTLTFKASNGSLVPLESLMAVKSTVGPQRINHYGQQPAAALSFGLRPGVSLGEAVAEIRQLGRTTLPATMALSFEGSAKVFEESLRNLGLLLFVAIGVVYIVLGMLYESYIHPLTILSGLPSAGLGALVTLWVFGSELNVYSFVGLIMLIGIVKKNAIMQIDFALGAERERGRTPTEAIYEGCVVRFRPIMMTTMAALLGSIPIALGYGAGGEARRPLGLAVVGGLIVSQLITLYLTPVVYTYMAALLAKRAPARAFAQSTAPV